MAQVVQKRQRDYADRWLNRSPWEKLRWCTPATQAAEVGLR
jgi:hypothetical protein